MLKKSQTGHGWYQKDLQPEPGPQFHWWHHVPMASLQEESSQELHFSRVDYPTLLNDATAEKSFQLTSVDDSDYVYIFASPEKTDELCAPIETNGIYSCRNEENIVLNFYRWQEGAVDFKNDMKTYRIYLINHETGHILGWGHVGCPKEGAIAPVMMQQSKGTDGCIPYGWPAYETIKSRFDR